jgi:hypothetical protein
MPTRSGAGASTTLNANLLFILGRLPSHIIHQQPDQAVENRVHLPIGFARIVERDFGPLNHTLLVTG